MRLQARSALIALGAFVGFACSESSTPLPDEPAADGGAQTDGASPTSDGGRDARADARSDGGASSSEKIPTVPAGAIRITPTEVTAAQYAEFLADVDGQDIARPATCAWNTTFAPSSSAGCASGASSPIRCVDWCDAYAFCEWAGLRLCTKTEWLAACGGATNDPYPYGASFNQASCQFNDPGGPVAVGSKTACEGGYPGLFDMLGNVAEWDGSCQGTAGATDRCGIHGGDFAAAADTFQCSTENDAARSAGSPKVGIRCCSK